MNNYQRQMIKEAYQEGYESGLNEQEQSGVRQPPLPGGGALPGGTPNSIDRLLNLVGLETKSIRREKARREFRSQRDLLDLIRRMEREADRFEREDELERIKAALRRNTSP